jgi:hypothetical protein
VSYDGARAWLPEYIRMLMLVVCIKAAEQNDAGNGPVCTHVTGADGGASDPLERVS